MPDKRPRHNIEDLFDSADDLIWPDDPDAVPEWRLQQERRAREIGIKLPNYRTRNEYDAAIALCTARVVREEAKDLVVVEVSPMLPPAAAAERFLEWLRASGRAGQHTSTQLRDLYGTHCQELNMTPVPENMLRKFLGGGKSPGCHKIKADAKLYGKRSRPTLWHISESVSILRIAA